MPAYLITGDDESLALAAVSDLVHRLVGEGDRSLMVDDFDEDRALRQVEHRRVSFARRRIRQRFAFEGGPTV